MVVIVVLQCRDEIIDKSSNEVIKIKYIAYHCEECMQKKYGENGI